MDLSSKLEEAESFLKQIRDRSASIKEELESLRNAEHQVLGRITTYKEIQEESTAPQPAELSPEDLAKLTMPATAEEPAHQVVDEPAVEHVGADEVEVLDF